MNRLLRRQPLMPLGIQREVDHHDRVLLHDADQQDQADDAHDVQRVPRHPQRQQRAHARRRQRGQDRQRVDVALVQHAQHDVHAHQRRQNQPQLVRQRAFVGTGRTRHAQRDALRQAFRLRRRLDGPHRRAQRHARRQVEPHRGGRVLRHARHLQRRRLLHDGGDARQRRGAAARRAQRQVHQRMQAGRVVTLRLQDHAVVVGLGEDGRDDALAEGVVQRVVDAAGRDAEARRVVAVHLHEGCPALRAGIGGGAAQLGQVTQAHGQALRPGIDLGRVHALQRKAVFGGAAFAVHRQVLCGLHQHRHARRGALGTGAQALHDGGLRFAEHAARMQVDHQPPVAQHGVVGRVHADDRADRLHRAVAQHRLGRRTLQRRHAVERHIGRRLHAQLQLTGALRGEQALGNRPVHQHRQQQRAQRDQQRQRLVRQHPVQTAVVLRDHAVHAALHGAADAALGMVQRLQPARRHHGHQGQRYHG